MLSALAAAPPEAGPDAGLFHLWSHAIFKALLFLAIGWAGMIAGEHGGARAAGQRARRTAAAGVVPLRPAVPRRRAARRRRPVQGARRRRLLGGRRRVRARAASSSSPCSSRRRSTAAYCTRAYLLLTAHVRPAPASPPVPLAVQAVLGVLVGAQRRRRPRAAHRRLRRRARPRSPGSSSPSSPSSSVWPSRCAVASTATRPRCSPAGSSRSPTAGLGADAAYLRLVATPVLALARLVAFLDTEVVDAYVRGTAVATRAAGWAGARGLPRRAAQLGGRPRPRGRRRPRPRGGARVVVSLLLLVPAAVGLWLVTGGPRPRRSRAPGSSRP